LRVIHQVALQFYGHHPSLFEDIFMRCYAITSMLFSLACLAPAHAEWFEATGSALIRGGDTASARSEATEDAVKRAMLFAGVSIRSVQQVTNGLLTGEQTEFDSDNEVQQVQIISERIRNGYLEVTIQADIAPDQQQCETLAYRKKVLIAPFKLAEPEQAVVGQLFELGKVSSQQLRQKLSEISQSSWSELLPAAIQVAQLTELERSALQQQFNARYLLTAQLDDISLGNEELKLAFWQPSAFQRFYHITLQVHDLNENRQVFSQQYQTQASWQGHSSKMVDPKQQQFWLSDYGKAAERVLNAAAIDIEEAIRCEPIEADIMQVSQHRVLLSLGQMHGVQVGDEFTLVHQQQVPDRHGQLRHLTRVTGLNVKVTQVSHQTAWAEADPSQLLANIQVGDIARVRRQMERDSLAQDPLYEQELGLNPQAAAGKPR
jgi:hypothetical protein